MKKALLGALAGAVLTAVAPAASAHVTVQPNEAVAGSFSRFVVRVPNERPDAGTTKVVVKLPPLAFVSFEDREGWKRKVRMVELDEPLQVADTEITETVGRVTWKGGRIGPGEFTEFGFSARMPDGEESLVFEALQTYSSGEVVEWTGAPDSETPAARLTTYDLGLEEGQGQLAVLAALAADESSDDDDGEAAGDDAEDEDEGTGTATVLSGIALVLALIALVLALRRGGTGETRP
ncbi:MAG TPA: YcnI family protein [Actinomycetota bacterium]|nr:YcnI family protein [Actinomycetota bacterium]